MNKKFSTLAIAAFCLASCHCDDDTPTTSQYITGKRLRVYTLHNSKKSSHS